MIYLLHNPAYFLAYSEKIASTKINLSVLTLSKHLFEPHTINQKFIEARDEYGSTHVVSLIRKQPWDLASDVHVLKEFFSLMQKSNVKIQVSGVSKLEPTDDMTEQERAKLELFLEYVDKEDKLNEEFWPEARDGRSVHFRFGQEVSNSIAKLPSIGSIYSTDTHNKKESSPFASPFSDATSPT